MLEGYGRLQGWCSWRVGRWAAGQKAHASLLAERGGLEGSTGGPLPCAWNDLRSLDQAEPGDRSPLARSTNSLDETPLILILLNHAKGLSQPDGQLVAQGWNVKRGHGHQPRAVVGTNVLAQVCVTSSVNQEDVHTVSLHPLAYAKIYGSSTTGSLNRGWKKQNEVGSGESPPFRNQRRSS